MLFASPNALLDANEGTLRAQVERILQIRRAQPELLLAQTFEIVVAIGLHARVVDYSRAGGTDPRIHLQTPSTHSPAPLREIDAGRKHATSATSARCTGKQRGDPRIAGSELAMKISLVLPLSFGLALAAAPSFAAPLPGEAAAPPGSESNADDEVVLSDGTALRGRITDQRAGSFVIIVTNDGRAHTVQWALVSRVTASTSMRPAAALREAPALEPPIVDAPAARAESHDSPPIRFELGTRIGYSFPSGDYLTGASFDRPSVDAATPSTKSSLPLIADLGLRIGSHWYMGGFFQYALVGTDCLQASQGWKINCDAHDIRVGAAFRYHFAPRGSVDPWVGWGLGYEWLSTSIAGTSNQGDVSVSQTFGGWNLLDVMFGVDVHATRSFGFGPYAELTYGTFANDSVQASGSGQSASASGSISSTSQHQWFTIGVRGAFDIGVGGDSL